MMLATLPEELGARGLSTVFGMAVGATLTWAIARYKRHRQRAHIHAGIARDTVVIQQHLIESIADPAVPGGRRGVSLRVRTLGQAELSRVVPNNHLAAVLAARAAQVKATSPLISMAGPEGSFLLETLTAFCGDRLGRGTFEHDLYVMAPCCEPKELATHKPIVILLIRVSDLALFEHWPACRGIQVEHGSDGARVLTLMVLAKRYREEQEAIAKYRKEGRRTVHIETMYVIDLALDQRSANVPLKQVPWGRFESVLRQMRLERL